MYYTRTRITYIIFSRSFVGSFASPSSEDSQGKLHGRHLRSGLTYADERLSAMNTARVQQRVHNYPRTSAISVHITQLTAHLQVLTPVAM